MFCTEVVERIFTSFHIFNYLRDRCYFVKLKKKVGEINADRIYIEIILICMILTTSIPAISLQNLDKRTYN